MDEQHRDNSGWTPLHYACLEGHREVVVALIEGGAHIDQTDNDSRAPLLLAAQEGHDKLVLDLIENYGAQVDQRALDGTTAFRYFVWIVVIMKLCSCHALIIPSQHRCYPNQLINVTFDI